MCSVGIKAPFDIFAIDHRDSWRAVKEEFYSEVSLIEGEAKSFIDASFKTLRSAEGAFEMLLNFRHIRSRDSINSQMMRKFNDILAQFDKEVRCAVSRVFVSLDSPRRRGGVVDGFEK